MDIDQSPEDDLWKGILELCRRHATPPTGILAMIKKHIQPSDGTINKNIPRSLLKSLALLFKEWIVRPDPLNPSELSRSTHFENPAMDSITREEERSSTFRFFDKLTLDQFRFLYKLFWGRIFMCDGDPVDPMATADRSLIATGDGAWYNPNTEGRNWLSSWETFMGPALPTDVNDPYLLVAKLAQGWLLSILPKELSNKACTPFVGSKSVQLVYVIK